MADWIKAALARTARLAISANVACSRAIDSILPESLRRDGNSTFGKEFLPRVVSTGGTVYDLGGGSRPFVSLQDKERSGLTLIGLDIDADELAAAPPGVYDRTITVDVCTYIGEEDADVVVCQAALEHVQSVDGALRAISSTLKPGGRVFLFAPCRNALFARLNVALPETLKRRLLFFIFPEKASGHDGFRAYYDHCTPSEIDLISHRHGLVIEERRTFWMSSYFFAFTPAYILWRLWQLIGYAIAKDNASETFIIVLRKLSTPDTSL